LRKDQKTASIIFAAGRGSRMKDYNGNKTLLPLVPGNSPFEGNHPILLHILDRLPAGPKAIVINHRKDDVIEFTRSLDITYCEQPQLNGTGGALLSSKEFIEGLDCDLIIITMGDVPFISLSTYNNLLKELDNSRMVVLGFRPGDKKQYGVLEFDKDNVKRITEWKYWSKYSKEKQDQLEVCNSGIYTVRKDDLIQYLRILEQRPHMVLKERNSKMVKVEEFFITDLIELMHKDGLKVGHVIAGDEDNVMGIDDLPSLLKAQEIIREQYL